MTAEQILKQAREEVLDAAGWNTLFDASVYLDNPGEYERAYGTGSLADRDKQ